MITFDEALAAVLNHARPLPAIELKLTAALDHGLACDVYAPFAMPMFDNSAVDGYGVRAADVARASSANPVKLKLIGERRAGKAENAVLSPASTIRVLTGAQIPQAVDAVIMREHVLEHQDAIEVSAPVAKGLNLRLAGEEFKTGDPLLSRGTRITPPVIGLLASIGQEFISATRLPVVAVISTGDELIQPGNELFAGQIYESSSSSISAAVRQLGIQDCSMVTVADDLDTLIAALTQALNSADVVITLGGVSVGEYDLVKAALEQIGVQQVFWRVAMKPGKPNYFGVLDADAPKLIFGLPGNPVSSLVSFEVLVRPALERLKGIADVDPFKAQAVLSREIRRRPGRLEFLRGRAAVSAQTVMVEPVAGQGSHMQGGLAKANCLILLPAEAECIPQGEAVTIQWLQW